MTQNGNSQQKAPKTRKGSENTPEKKKQALRDYARAQCIDKAPGRLQEKSKTRNGLKSRVGNNGMSHATQQNSKPQKIQIDSQQENSQTQTPKHDIQTPSQEETSTPQRSKPSSINIKNRSGKEAEHQPTRKKPSKMSKTNKITRQKAKDQQPQETQNETKGHASQENLRLNKRTKGRNQAKELFGQKTKRSLQQAQVLF